MLNSGHLIELAEQECNADTAGAPRQANLRRAASTAYYAVFHELLGTIATTFVAANQRKARALFYRALDHKRTKERCKRLGQSPLPREERSFFEMEAFSETLRLFANEFVALQERRHSCDYDPDLKTTREETQEIIDTAQRAIQRLRHAIDTEKAPFLSYLLFGLRN